VYSRRLGRASMMTVRDEESPMIYPMQSAATGEQELEELTMTAERVCWEMPTHSKRMSTSVRGTRCTKQGT
jgi:hypothetical protein